MTSTEQSDNAETAAGCGCLLVGLIGLSLPVAAYLGWGESWMPSWPLWQWILVGAIITFVVGPLVGVSLEYKVKGSEQESSEHTREDEPRERQGANDQGAEIAREEMREEQATRAEERDPRTNAPHQTDEVMDRVNHMSGLEFEQFMADLFHDQGYSVRRTSDLGDQGIDFLLNIEDRTVTVQLKRWTAPVGDAAVHATFAGMVIQNAQEAWLITTGSFTRSAVEVARKIGVRLLDGNDLAEWVKGYKG